ncbi:hypothetical protein J3459_010315 [Metarhizium acridum]|uniref:uncharacterized protein n=1 Tax=Metarhizium acridum TaxID=92637 RepID=UPI001C6B85E4|nr:hypothetical protein J3459_010315 [Metarhizium acridum]KAG8424959.1 hypothetical protein J3458_001708 [Metarhizium acridum]
MCGKRLGWSHTQWDSSKCTRTVVVNRILAGGTSEIRKFHPRHIIQATGHSAKKNQPTIAGQDSFTGLLYHPSKFPGAQSSSAEKRAVVVRSWNPAPRHCTRLHREGIRHHRYAAFHHARRLVQVNYRYYATRDIL